MLMKKDIPQLKVADLAVAIAPRKEEGVEAELWDTFLLNLKDEPILNVLVSSRGYGEVDGEQLETTTLRHFFEEIPPLSAAQIEPIQTSLFGLNNEYWVSFSLNNYMYDKKYTFLQGSISEDYFTVIPLLECEGVMIR